jgi:hypothetical protein
VGKREAQRKAARGKVERNEQSSLEEAAIQVVLILLGFNWKLCGFHNLDVKFLCQNESKSPAACLSCTS